MENNRTTWGLIALLVLFTIAISSGSLRSIGQEQTSLNLGSTPIPFDTRDLSKYGSVQYAGYRVEPDQERSFAGQRYDGFQWVFTSVENNPYAAAVGRITHDPLPPAFPVKESLLIVVGEVAEVKAYLSNDKGCVYTEFTIKPDEILKDGGSKTLDVVRADREGGIVIYPNGQRILYSSSTLGLPLLGGKYLFFLGKKGKSPNYEILTAYDVNGENASRLEYDESTGEPPRTSRFELIQDVRLRIAKIGKR